MFSIIKIEDQDLSLIKDKIEKEGDFLEFSTLYNKKNFDNLLFTDEYSNLYKVEEGIYQLYSSPTEIFVYQIEKATSWFHSNGIILKYKLKLIKNNTRGEEEIKKVSSNSNMLLELSNAMNNTQYNIDDHLPDKNDNEYTYMWLLFDNKGTYLTMCKSLNYCQEFIRALSSERFYYPILSEEDNKLLVVSLSFNGDKMEHHAVKVKILKHTSLNIKAQITHWKNIIKEHIHKFIIPTN